MNTTELETKIKSLEEKITALNDINEIKELQRIYGYYLDNHMTQDIIDLFSDKCEYFEATDEGRYLGKEGVKRFFLKMDKPPMDQPPKGQPPDGGLKSPFGLHFIVQDVVNVDPGGKTAHGRWQLLGLTGGASPTEPGKKNATWLAGVYENEFIKEDGKWKYKNVIFHLYFFTSFEEGWAKIPYIIPRNEKGALGGPDIPASEDKLYPTGYLLPVHFKNPVTGK